jgi:hypothetical protein
MEKKLERKGRKRMMEKVKMNLMKKRKEKLPHKAVYHLFQTLLLRM